MKKLYRSRENKVIAGVCGGLAEYFGVDVVVMRLIWVILALMGGPGVLGYIIAWIVMPLEPEPRPELAQPGLGSSAAPSQAERATEGASDGEATATEGTSDADSTPPSVTEETPNTEGQGTSASQPLLAILLIALGVFFLLRQFVPQYMLRWFSWSRWWPLVLIVAGLAVIMKSSSK